MKLGQWGGKFIVKLFFFPFKTGATITSTMGKTYLSDTKTETVKVLSELEGRFHHINRTFFRNKSLSKKERYKVDGEMNCIELRLKNLSLLLNSERNKDGSSNILSLKEEVDSLQTLEIALQEVGIGINDLEQRLLHYLERTEAPK